MSGWTLEVKFRPGVRPDQFGPDPAQRAIMILDGGCNQGVGQVLPEVRISRHRIGLQQRHRRGERSWRKQRQAKGNRDGNNSNNSYFHGSNTPFASGPDELVTHPGVIGYRGSHDTVL